MWHIIYTTVKPSHLKIVNHTKYRKPNVPSHLHIFRLNFEKSYPGEKVISFCLGPDDKNLGASFEWGVAWVKMPWINAFSRNVNSINLKIFPTHGGI